MPADTNAMTEHRFKSLIARHRAVSLTLAAIMLAIYFGFILLAAFFRELLALPIGSVRPLGLVAGLLVILSAIALTGVYVRWANANHDRRLRDVVAGMRTEDR